MFCGNCRFSEKCSAGMRSFNAVVSAMGGNLSNKNMKCEKRLAAWL